ncbi:DUF6254 family protein [Pontibacillus yanchengensis]|nr:DUF6254 family protein [Pontibacillus yanchengensis]
MSVQKSRKERSLRQRKEKQSPHGKVKSLEELTNEYENENKPIDKPKA